MPSDTRGFAYPDPLNMPDLNEDAVSKLPALHLLQNIGYTYLSPEEALRLRGKRLDKVILDGVLIPWLREHNSIRHRNSSYPFSEGNIFSAVQALDLPLKDGLIRANEAACDLLFLGKSLQQSMDGDIKSFTLQYIDWENPKNNTFHVTEEFVVERSSSNAKLRPDIVLFVNGIPFVIIECKSPKNKDPMGEAISEQIRNQKEDGVPKLYIYSQLLMAVSKNEAKYGTTGTARKFWSVWREEEGNEEFEKRLKEIVNIALSEEQIDKLFTYSQFIVRQPNPHYGFLHRQVTDQDKSLISLCSPERLLELSFRYTLFDAGEKKIARYQQYFCVRKISNRILTLDHDGRRTGGVVWHTQGSGKSLTMVMLAKAIALEKTIPDYKIILVTDRVDLDDQIYKTFQHCHQTVIQAKTGRHLSELLMGHKSRIITTVVDKFEAALGRHAALNGDTNIFVLVDEAHRSQYKTLHANMRRVLSNACYIGFTGTPVMKRDKNTVAKFGGLIDTYTIDRAVNDKAVVPLLYEGRHVLQNVDSESIDAWFERITEKLSKEQTADLKRKFATTDQLNKAEQKVSRVAWDISEHFRDNWKGIGFKGQLVAQDKATALLYKKYLDEFGMLSSEVLISAPDQREGEEDLYKQNKLEVQRFWKGVLARFGNEREYNKQLINQFRSSGDPEIIIVVDKLLTGFDAPRNTILYLTRQLKDHTLLQAIARVNRLFDGKDFGYIIDYRGILENLDHALDLYNTFPDFDSKDLENILTDINEEINNLPQCHSVLWDIFKTIKNKSDVEEYERLLSDESLRPVFYERLSLFARTLSTALSSEQFLDKTTPEWMDRFRNDLKFFSNLRISVRKRYAEVVDFAEYEPKIQKLLDIHVSAGEVEKITPLVNIFDQEAFTKEVEKFQGADSKADVIAHRTLRAIHDHLQEDPAFYKRFSQLLREVIREFRNQRIQANEYLRRVTEIMQTVMNRTDESIPEILKNKEVARAYYGSIREILSEALKAQPDHERWLAEIALIVDEIIEKHRIVHWSINEDVKNRMKNDLEDSLFDIQKKRGIQLTVHEIDDIMNQCIEIAQVRRP